MDLIVNVPISLVIADSTAKFICSSTSVSSTFCFASFALVIIPFSPLKALNVTPANINKTIIVITKTIFKINIALFVDICYIIKYKNLFKFID